jgi:hypothetical protein
MSSTNRLEFGDTGTYIHQSANGVLDLVSDTEIEINATTIDINGAVDISGDTTTAGNLIIDADDKGLILGDGQDATIYSDGSGQVMFVMGSGTGVDTNEGSIQFNITDSSDTTQNLKGGEGASAILRLSADQGDDDDDSYRLVANASGNFLIESASTGSWVTQIAIDGSAADVTVSTGDLIFGTAGKGICLGVTSNTDANTLDDYEEGTWTGVVSDGTNPMTMNASYTTGFYTKVGNLVHVSGYFATTSLGSASGGIRITGLPFTIANNAAAYSGGCAAYGAGLDIDPIYTVAYYGMANTTNIALLVWDVTGGVTGMQASEWSDNGESMIGFSYRAA